MISAEELMIERRLSQYAKRAMSVEEELARLKQPCKWVPDKDVSLSDKGFNTGCGAWYLNSAIESYFFCPNCGHPIEVQP